MGNILLTGASGKLGTSILRSNNFINLLCPNRSLFDLTLPTTINSFLEDHNIDTVIHCAALARMSLCDKNPSSAILNNIIGTSNLVREIIKIEKKKEKSIRFIHISTDGVYAGLKGNYSENDPTIPYNNYGWSKLGAECAVHLLSNYVIVRTRFFDPNKIPYSTAAIDLFTSSIPLPNLVTILKELTFSSFTGTMNIGDERMSDFERYKKYKSTIQKCKRIDIRKNLSFDIAVDASMNLELLRNLGTADD